MLKYRTKSPQLLQWIDCNKVIANQCRERIEELISICFDWCGDFPTDLKLFGEHALEMELLQACNGDQKRIKSKSIDGDNVEYEYLDNRKLYVDWFGIKVNPEYLRIAECYKKRCFTPKFGRYC